MSDSASASDSVSVVAKPLTISPPLQPTPVVHAGLGVSAHLPHISMFSLSGVIYAIAAANGDLNSILTQLMTLAPALGGFISVIHVAWQNIKAGWTQGITATPQQALAQAISIAQSYNVDKAAIQNFVTSFTKAIKSQ